MPWVNNELCEKNETCRKKTGPGLVSSRELPVGAGGQRQFERLYVGRSCQGRGDESEQVRKSTGAQQRAVPWAFTPTLRTSLSFLLKRAPTLPSPPSADFIFFVALTYNQPTCLPLIFFTFLILFFFFTFFVFSVSPHLRTPHSLSTGAGTRSPFVR